MCQYVSVCVVLLVASVLSSMRWVLCGGDGSKEKNEICNNEKKIPRGIFLPLRFLIDSKTHVPHQITDITDLITSTIFAVKPRPLAQVTGCPFF